MRELNKLESQFYWEEAWKNHIGRYLDSAPRCGFFLSQYLSGVDTILEIAGGSCRDSFYLANEKVKVCGSDFDDKTIRYLSKKLKKTNFTLQVEDAYNLSFSDKSFELSFSNGFWVCVRDNLNITTLIREQARVTKKYLISIVHNAENVKLVKRFERLSNTDELYRIRFFDKSELKEIITNSGITFKSIKMMKFGGYADILVSKYAKILPIFVKKFIAKILPRLYQFQSWSNTERIACIVEL